MTHPGRFRKHNEDSFLALTFDSEGVRYLGKEGVAPVSDSDFVFAVSDGMGGANAGEFASRIAVEKITELMTLSFRLGGMGLARDYVDILVELFSRIHHEMCRMGFCYEECRGMGATLSLGWFSPGWFYFAHLGDSRIYYLPQSGPMVQLTEDHTHVGWLLREGKINEREARSHPRRSYLQKGLGGKHQQAEPQVGAVRCEPGDRFVFCSDGINEGVWDRALEDMIRNPSVRLEQWCPAERLVQEAMAAASRDNLTALVVTVAE